MEYYPQPRPVLYGTSAEETPPQTQTAPVRIGPPRYPPAPPSTGYAPEPHDPRRRRPLRGEGEKGRAPRVVLYTFTAAIAYSLLQVVLTAAGFAVGLAAPLVLLVEIAISLVVLACLWMLGGREYLMAVGLLAVHISLGVAFAQWQSPLLWVAIAVMVYLLWPSMLKWYGWMAVEEIRMDIARYRRHHPRRCASPSFRQPPRPDLSEWRIR
jgi:hypothetical protein